MPDSNRASVLLSEKLKEAEHVQKIIDEAVRKAELIAAQVAVLRQVLPDEGAEQPGIPAPASVLPPSAPSQRKKRGRRGVWRDVLIQTARSFPAQFTTDDIQSAAATMGIDLPRSTVRSQAANYVDYGWLNRIKQGHFNLTDDGRKELGLISNSAPPASVPVVSAPPSPPTLSESKESETDDTNVEDLI